jgi:pimeloyl-ACP methyl ester carboxylesterase
MGGMVVQHMVLSDADRIRALVLMDTSHACPDGLDPDTIALGREVVAQGGLELLIELQEAQGVDPLATPAHRRMLAERPGYAEFGRRNTLNASADMWQAIVAEIVDQADRLDALHSVAVPTLVIVGDQDAPFMAHSERMAKAIAGAQLAVIADAGHSPQFEAPAAWFDALTRFLDEVRT